jgi:hypothetical protein
MAQERKDKYGLQSKLKSLKEEEEKFKLKGINIVDRRPAQIKTTERTAISFKDWTAKTNTSWELVQHIDEIIHPLAILMDVGREMQNHNSNPSSNSAKATQSELKKYEKNSEKRPAAAEILEFMKKVYAEQNVNNYKNSDFVKAYKAFSDEYMKKYGNANAKLTHDRNMRAQPEGVVEKIGYKALSPKEVTNLEKEIKAGKRWLNNVIDKKILELGKLAVQENLVNKIEKTAVNAASPQKITLPPLPSERDDPIVKSTFSNTANPTTAPVTANIQPPPAFVTGHRRAVAFQNMGGGFARGEAKIGRVAVPQMTQAADVPAKTASSSSPARPLPDIPTKMPPLPSIPQSNKSGSGSSENKEKSPASPSPFSLSLRPGH